MRAWMLNVGGSRFGGLTNQEVVLVMTTDVLRRPQPTYILKGLTYLPFAIDVVRISWFIEVIFLANFALLKLIRTRSSTKILDRLVVH
jgi:hypothetical protein